MSLLLILIAIAGIIIFFMLMTNQKIPLMQNFEFPMSLATELGTEQPQNLSIPYSLTDRARYMVQAPNPELTVPENQVLNEPSQVGGVNVPQENEETSDLPMLIQIPIERLPMTRHGRYFKR